MRERELEKKTLGRRAGNGGVLANRRKKKRWVKDSVVLDCGQKR